MPWFVIDDSAHSHPKVVAAKNPAFGLWVRCGSYAAQHLTDGIVPGDIAKMYGTRPQIAKLVAAGLWHEHGHTCPHAKCAQPAPGDFYMHDYLDPYNPSRAEVLARKQRAADKKRKQRAGGSAAEQQRFDDDPSTDHMPNEDDSAGRDDASPGDRGGTRAGAFPSPPRPSHGGTERALSAIPAEWQPSDDDVADAQIARADAGRAQLTPQQIAAVTRKFVRRMSDDGTRATSFGGRWQQWAENERTEQQSVGGNVVHLPGAMTKSQQQRAGLDRLRERLNEGSGA